MKLPKRFALSTLLLVMLLVSLVCGLIQWRRLGLIAEIERLNEIGAVPVQRPDEIGALSLTFPDIRLNARTLTELHVKGSFWPSAYPKIVVIRGYKHASGRYDFGGKSRSPRETKDYLNELEHRLRAIGIMMVLVVQLKSEFLLEPHGMRHIVEEDVDVQSLE